MMSDFDDLPKEKDQFISQILTMGFTPDEIKILIDEKLQLPSSELLKSHIDKTIEIDEFDQKSGKIIQKYGRQKGTLSKKKSKKQKDKNSRQNTDELTKDIKTLQKYRNRVDLIRKGSETTWHRNLHSEKEKRL